MRERARKDLCGGRSAMVVPTAPLHGDRVTLPPATEAAGMATTRHG